MKLTAFKFDVPKEQIALYPTKDRDGSKLMILHRKTGKIEHKKFKDIINYFDEGDTFIVNDTKVFPARMWGNKEKTGAKIEVFLLRELNRDSLLWDVVSFMESRAYRPVFGFGGPKIGRSLGEC